MKTRMITLPTSSRCNDETSQYVYTDDPEQCRGRDIKPLHKNPDVNI